VHDWGDYALTKLALASDADRPAAQSRSDEALRCLLTFQRLGPAADPERGVFQFHIGGPAILRDNPTEFALAPLAALLVAFPPSAALRKELESSVATALDAMERRNVCPKYTNICLIQAAEMIALGGVLRKADDPATREFGEARVASGKARLDQWIAFTRDAGIAEFDSPTYSAVDLMALLIAMHGAEEEAVRAKVSAALDYFWRDLAGNFFPGRGSLAGPHSRSYSLFTGQGPLALSYYLEGLRAQPPETSDLSAGVLVATIDWLNAQKRGYRPPESALCTVTAPEREIVSTFGPKGGAGGRQRYTFITPEFSLGSASADTGNQGNDQDEAIRAELASSPKTSAIAVLADYLDSPGVSKLKLGDFAKVTHLRMGPVAAQKKGTMLALLRVDATDPKYAGEGESIHPVNLATNIVIPADADEILIDGRPVDRARDVSVDGRPTLVVRIGTGAVAVSVLDASGVECSSPSGTFVDRHSPTIQFKPLEAAGNDHGPIARLTIYHETALPADLGLFSDCFARVALAVVAERCTGDGCAAGLSARVSAANRAARKEFDPRTGDWDVQLRVAGGSELRVHRVLGATEKGDRLLGREVDGREMTFVPLRVNDRVEVLGP
jgi:hypothetical protein